MTISISQSPKIKPFQDEEVVLSVEGVSKKFCRSLKHSLFYGIQDIATDIAGMRSDKRELRNKEFWALDNVSFELRKGEALGLVGKNGSGKSTLLRIIAGLIKPDKGQVKIKGTVAPLIALGAGFNPILTGRENIYANMSILGLSKQQIDDRFDDVVEFAEIGEAIDSPVSTYSSGMAARLGFASAIHTEPDILLIDEVLAVGDVKFRAKCHRKLHELRQKGKSFVLVSHQSLAILAVCNSATYLSQGKLIASGETSSIMKLYEKDLFSIEQEQESGKKFFPEKSEEESTGVDILSILFKDAEGNIIDRPVMGETTYLCVGCKAHRSFSNVGFNVSITPIGGEGGLTLFLSNFDDGVIFNLESGKYEIKLKMPRLGLKYGSYTMKIGLRKDTLFAFDIIESFRFTVQNDGLNINQSIYYQPHEWQISTLSASSHS